MCDPSANYIHLWNTLTNEVSWELPQVFEPTQAPTPAIEQVEQNTLSQKEVDDQNLTEDQSSLETGETSTESKDVTITQAAESVVITSCVADQPEEFPIQGPGKLPPARKTCTLEQAVKDTNSSSCDNLVSEYLDEKKWELDHTTSCEECRKPKSLSQNLDQTIEMKVTAKVGIKYLKALIHEDISQPCYFIVT